MIQLHWGQQRLAPPGLLLFAVITCCLGCPAAAQADEPLHVLLLNDDGFEAEGLRAMQRALVGAGHRVTIYAPQKNWSGSGASLTLPSVAAVEPQPGEVAVAGSPATTVLVAAGAWQGPPPDIAISGINHGTNAGAISIFSGTVGGALTAAGPFAFETPAMAVSADLFDGKPEAADNRAHLDRVARLATKLVDQLVLAADGARLLPQGVVLNVNHPAVVTPKGIVLVPQSSRSHYRLAYKRQESGDFVVKLDRTESLAAAEGDRAIGDSDVAALGKGYVTIAPIRADLTAHDLLQGEWRARLEAVGAAAGKHE